MGSVVLGGGLACSWWGVNQGVADGGDKVKEVL